MLSQRQKQHATPSEIEAVRRAWKTLLKVRSSLRRPSFSACHFVTALWPWHFCVQRSPPHHPTQPYCGGTSRCCRHCWEAP